MYFSLKLSDILTTDDIYDKLSANKFTCKYLCGVYALDRLPKQYISVRPALVVANTAYSGSLGEHWVCFFLSDNSITYFDSYGLPPSNKYFDEFIYTNGANSKTLRWNSTCLQGLTATTCGKYVCTFLLYKCLGFSTKSYIRLLLKMGSAPDDSVRKIYKYHFGSQKKKEKRWGSVL